MPIPSESWTFKRLFARMEQWDLSLTSSYILLTIGLVAAAIRRFYNIDTYSLWSDELWGVVACSKDSWWAMIENLIQHDSHPPGYQTLLYWWMKLVGDSDFSIRAPSAIAGLAAVYWTFELGRRHFSAITGLIAAFGISGAFQSVYFSQEARAYIFLVCLAPAFACYYIELFLQKLPDRRQIALYGFWATATLLMYFHYVGSVILACSAGLWCIHWLKTGHTRSDFYLALRAFGVPLLLYLPWLPVMYHHLADAPASWATPTPNFQRVIDTYRYLLGPDDARFYSCLITLALLTLLRFIPYFNKLSQRTHPATYLYKQQAWNFLFWLCVLPVLVFVIQAQLSHSAYTMRHFTYSIPLFSVLLACFPATIARLIPVMRWRVRYVLFVVIFSAIMNMHYNAENGVYEHYMKEDYRGAVDLILHDKRFIEKFDRNSVLTNSEFFDHYLRRTGLRNHADFLLTDANQLPDLERWLAQTKPEKFYYLETGSRQPSAIMQSLASRYEARCFSRLNKINAAKFSLKPAAENALPLTELHDCPLKSLVRRPDLSGQAGSEDD